MSHIIRGSLVSVVFSITAFSHSTVENLHSYSGVPCLLDITAGTGMILNALDQAILSMQVGDVRDICIPAADAPESARALGVQMRGMLKYELKVVGVINTPSGPDEIARFLRKGNVTLNALRENRDVKKGPFNISRTYDMFEAAAISEEFRILESLHKDRVSHSLHNSEENQNHNENGVSSHSRKRLRQKEKEKSVPCYSVPFGSDNIDSRFLIPTWPIDIPKEEFLPHLMSLALRSKSKVIVLFDAPNDWQNIEQFRSEFRSEQLNNDELNSTDEVPYRYSIMDNKSSATSNNSVPIPGSVLSNVLHTNISFSVESEEVDSTGECVLTWLRIYAECSAESSREPSAEPSSFMEDVSYKNKTSASEEGNEDEDEEGYNGKITKNNNTEETNINHIPSQQYPSTSKNKNKNKNKENQASDVIGMDRGPVGFRIALIRFAGWDRGSPPQNRLWQKFIDIYDK